MTKFKGVLPVIPTPFLETGEVDLDSLKNIVSYAIDCGISACVYPGVASEDIQLSPEERAKCVDVVTTHADGRVKIIAGVNSNESSQMVTLAKQMKSYGVDGIMAMAVPNMAERGFKYWFQAISDATGGLPIILQNLYAPRGADLSALEMLALAADVDAIRYVKEEGIPSGPKVTKMIDSMTNDLDGVIGGGGARYVFEELERGVVASMPAIELLELHVDLLNAYYGGDRGSAFDLYERSLPILLTQAPYRMRLTKLILKHRGIIKTDLVREKLPPLDEKSKALILEMYKKLDIAKIS